MELASLEIYSPSLFYPGQELDFIYFHFVFAFCICNCIWSWHRWQFTLCYCSVQVKIFILYQPSSYLLNCNNIRSSWLCRLKIFRPELRNCFSNILIALNISDRCIWLRIVWQTLSQLQSQSSRGDLENDFLESWLLSHCPSPPPHHHFILIWSISKLNWFSFPSFLEN